MSWSRGDLKDLIAVRREMGYGNHGGDGGLQEQGQQQGQGGSATVMNELEMPVGHVGTSGNVYDLTGSGAGTGVGVGAGQAPLRTAESGPTVGAWSQNELSAVYLACDVAETVQRLSVINALQQNGVSMSTQKEHHGINNNHNTYDPRQQHQQDGCMSRSHSGTEILPGSPSSLHSQHQQLRQRHPNYNLDSRHILVPETI